jgi:outer membrane lipoprotein-sorting protein
VRFLNLAVLLVVALPWTAPGESALTPEEAASLGAKQLVERFEEIFRGQTAQMKASMKIERPRWTRTMTFRSWDDRAGDRAFVRILSPSKDRGTGFLRESKTLWTYLPRVERTTRIPPSMMLQPWMGSDFTNDDLVRESSLIEDYEPSDLGIREIEGQTLRGIQLVAREEAPVVWARVEIWFDPSNFVPLLQVNYDEPEPGRYEPIREMRYSDVREVQGRPLPHAWVMTPLDKPGHVTSIRIEEMQFDEPLDDGIFTQANLKRAEATR